MKDGRRQDDRILSICNDSGFSPTALQEASEMQTILSMVASGLGVAILPRSAGALGLKELAVRPLEGSWLPSEVGTAILKSAGRDPLLSTFLEVTRRLE
jgi:DNA-binding transcriptional LysR family regulator